MGSKPSPDEPTVRDDEDRDDEDRDDDDLEALYHFGPTALGCCVALAAQAARLCGDHRIRIDFPPFREDGEAGAVPVRAPNEPERVDALLRVEPRGAGSPPCHRRLALLARRAGLVLERHRMARELGRIWRDVARERSELAHKLRGPLNSALLRVDALLYSDPDARVGEDGVTSDLRGLRDSVTAMAESIQGILEVPESALQRPSVPRADSLGPVRISDLLRTVGETAGLPGGVNADADLAPVSADRDRLMSALAELFDLSRQARSAPEITVAPDGTEAIRVTAHLEPSRSGPQQPESAAPESDPEGWGAPPTTSLAEVVRELGGRLWIKAGRNAGAQVSFVLPTTSGEGAGDTGPDGSDRT